MITTSDGLKESEGKISELTVSFIIPYFNSGKTIAACLQAIFNQAKITDEILLINDGGLLPKDLPYLNDERLKCFSLNENQGSAAARDFGAHKAQGDLLLFVDADVALSSTARSMMEKRFLEDLSLSLCFAGLEISPKSGFFSDYKNLYMSYILSHLVEQLNYVYGCCCVSRRSTYLPWPRGVRYIDDSVWGYEYFRSGKKIVFASDILVDHQKEYKLGSLIKNDFRVAREFMIFFLERKRWSVVTAQEKFGHTSLSQVFSLIVAVLIPFCFFLHPLLLGLAIMIWVFVQFGFWSYFFKQRGFLFVLKAVAWTYFDHFIYLSGMVVGLFLSVLGLRKLHVH